MDQPSKNMVFPPGNLSQHADQYNTTEDAAADEGLCAANPPSVLEQLKLLFF